VISEPHGTALIVAIFGLLLGVSVLSSRASERTGVPAVLLFLGVGILAGSEGLLGIRFEDYGFAFRMGSIALALILFDAGLNTPFKRVRTVLAPSLVLATAGVLASALVLALGAWVLGLPWPVALLLGAIVSSTDAAATFSVLRGSGLSLHPRVGSMLELESGLNDPLAVLLTVAISSTFLASGEGISWLAIGGNAVLELVLGAAYGIAGGRLGVAVLRRVKLVTTGLYPVLSLALALLVFGLATLLKGSGFLAVYVAALVIGNAGLPYKASLARVHDAMAWLAQIGMFLILGLLVFPSRLLEVAPMGLAVAAVLGLAARPIAVFLSLLPFGIPRREQLLIAWAGLRGAVPIVLAAYPILLGVPGAETIFDLVFFVVLVSALVHGGTVPWVTRKLQLESDEPPPPPAVLEIVSMQPLEGALLTFFVDEALDITGVPLSELPFPDGTAVTLILRGETLIVPKGHTTLEAGDHVYVATANADRDFVHLLFGQPESA
jgi:cell volume regulation protein A